MARVLKTLRTHWKKSIFFSCVAAYGVNYGKNKFQEKQLMKQYCKEALQYGEPTVPVSHVPYHVTVVLNPATCGGKGRSRFESYCAPLLHLAGIKVSVIRTEGEGQAKEIMEVVSDCDAVLIAGGDGTLMEAMTGWMRRHKDNKFERFRVPIGLLPVGTENRIAKNLFPTASSDVKLMAEATMAVVRQLYLRPIDVIEVENVTDSDDSNFSGKKIYGLREIQAGAFRDAEARMPKYWFTAGLKKYLTYIFAYTSSAKHIFWEVKGNFEKLVEEETSENNESEKVLSEPSWSEWILSKLIGSSAKQNVVTDTSPNVEKCENVWEQICDNFCGSEITIQTGNNFSMTSEPSRPFLSLTFGPDNISFTDFVAEGWRRQRNKNLSNNFPETWKTEDARVIKWTPDPQIFDGNKERFFNMDGEVIDMKGSMKVSLIPGAILMFCSPESCYKYEKPEEVKVATKWWRKIQPQQKVASMAVNKNF